MPGSCRARTRKDGSTVYQARWRPPGDGTELNRRAQTFATKREARAWLNQKDHEAETGTYIDPRRGGKKLKVVAGEWSEAEWFDLKPRTKADTQHIIDKHIVPVFGARRVGAVDAASVQTWINKFAKTHAPSTVRNVFGVLNRICDFAVRRHYVALNPCASVRVPRSKHEQAHRRKLQVVLKDYEITVLAEAMPNGAYTLATFIAVFCGLRAGELWALQRKHVGLDAATITVAQAQAEVTGTLVYGDPKSEAAHRTLSVPKPLRPLLVAHLAEPSTATRHGVVVIRETRGGLELGYSADPFDADGLVFTTAGGYPVRHNNFRKNIFRPTQRLALPHLPNLRWHDLRHTCASLIIHALKTDNPKIAREVAAFDVMKRLGHEDIRTTINTYTHLLPSADDVIADHLGELFGARQPENVVALRA